MLLFSDIPASLNAILPEDFGGRVKLVLREPGWHWPVHAEEASSKAETLRLVRNRHHRHGWQARALNAVDFVHISDQNERVLQLKSGQAQVISAVPLTEASALQADPPVAPEEFPSLAATVRSPTSRRPSSWTGCVAADQSRARRPGHRVGHHRRHRQAVRCSSRPADSTTRTTSDAELQPQRGQGRAAAVADHASSVSAAGVECNSRTSPAAPLPSSSSQLLDHGHARRARSMLSSRWPSRPSTTR